MTKNILVVDDDAHIREVICFALEQEGMTVVEAVNGKDALEQFQKSHPDMIVLDVMMPEMDGLEVCKEVRKTSEIPILFLSARNEEIDRIIGLEIGGDDYISKPFSPRELTARVKAIFRRYRSGNGDREIPENDSENILMHGNLTLNVESHTITWNNTAVVLTAREFSLLKALLRYPEKVFVRDTLMDRAYANRVTVSDRTIDSHIRGIRNKFSKIGCDDVIDTVHGVGYKLGTCL